MLYGGVDTDRIIMIFEPDETDRLRRAETSDIRNRLARQISMFVGDEDERMTSLPGLSFAKVRKPMPRSSYLYEPSISMIVRGSKRVQLGGPPTFMMSLAFY